MRVGKGNRGTKWQLWGTLAWLHVEHSRLEAGESFILETEAGVIRVVFGWVWVCVGAHSVRRWDEAVGGQAKVLRVFLID
jgi:hypothetical protein